MTAEKNKTEEIKRQSWPFYLRRITDFIVFTGFLLCIPSVMQIPDPPDVLISQVPDTAEEALPLKKTPSHFFSKPKEIQPQIDFWKKVFTQYNRDHFIVHDNWYVNVVYEVVERDSGKDPWKNVKESREKYRAVLKEMSENWDQPDKLTGEALRVYLMFQEIPESSRFSRKDALDRLHVQQGHADSFKSGIIRSGRYMDEMKKILADRGVPEELVWLPLIESAYTYDARSYAGAGGLWQLMGATAKQYGLKMNHLVDERRDPLISTRAAARHLSINYNDLKSWPLAITAYNHGLGGMKRAVRTVRSKNIGKIIEKYDGPRFEFASRNFYPEFLAALEIGMNYKQYYGDIQIESAVKTAKVYIPDYVKVETLEKYWGIEASQIRELNPALMPAVFDPDFFIPKGLRLNVPETCKTQCETMYAYIPEELKLEHIPEGTHYRVRKGQTLSNIAKLHKVSLKSLAMANGIRNPKRIRPGQRLKIPGQYITPADSQFSLKTAQIKKTTGPVSSVRSHKVKKGQNLSDIANFYGVSALSIAKLNKIKNSQKIIAGKVLKIPVKYPSSSGISKRPLASLSINTHKVKRGQTLSDIANMYGISAKSIAKLNKINNLRKIRAGQTLKIPEG